MKVTPPVRHCIATEIYNRTGRLGICNLGSQADECFVAFNIIKKASYLDYRQAIFKSGDFCSQQKIKLQICAIILRQVTWSLSVEGRPALPLGQAKLVAGGQFLEIFMQPLLRRSFAKAMLEIFVYLDLHRE